MYIIVGSKTYKIIMYNRVIFNFALLPGLMGWKECLLLDSRQPFAIEICWLLVFPGDNVLTILTMNLSWEAI